MNATFPQRGTAPLQYGSGRPAGRSVRVLVLGDVVFRPKRCSVPRSRLWVPPQGYWRMSVAATGSPKCDQQAARLPTMGIMCFTPGSARILPVVPHPRPQDGPTSVLFVLHCPRLGGSVRITTAANGFRHHLVSRVSLMARFDAGCRTTGCLRNRGLSLDARRRWPKDGPAVPAIRVVAGDRVCCR